MTQAKSFLPKLFKGIALFTPGGDLIYCIDPSKLVHWHLHLCAGLQEILDLPEPPHFLVPCYTATIDRWLDPQVQQVRTFAEAYPPVLKYRALLNAVFGIEELVWQPAPWPDGLCDPIVLSTYRQQFPQLWEEHEIVFRFERSPKSQVPLTQTPHVYCQSVVSPPLAQESETPGYVLRLFVAGHSQATERIFQSLHQMLEKSLHQPYTLKVIDVFKHPEQAEADQVSATPALVKVWPQPTRRLVGEFEDVENILQILRSPDNSNF